MKRLQAMLNSKDWQQQLALARDKSPGTEFDRIFSAAHQVKALEVERRYPDLIEKIYAFIGRQLAEIILQGDSQAMHEMGDALNKWKRHRPKEHKIRTALLREAGPRKETSVRKVLARLKREGTPTDHNTPRTIRTMASELNIRLGVE